MPNSLIADRTPAKEPNLWKRAGEALTSPGSPLTDLTTVKLSRKRCPKTSGRTCVESMLCKVHPELYVPPSSQTHKESTWSVPFQEAGYAVLIGIWVVKDGVLWSGGVIWTGGLDWRWWCDLWWSNLVVGTGRDGTMVCCGIRMWWSDLGCDLIVLCGVLIDCFHGLIWRCAWGRWSGLKADGWKLKR